MTPCSRKVNVTIAPRQPSCPETRTKSLCRSLVWLTQDDGTLSSSSLWANSSTHHWDNKRTPPPCHWGKSCLAQKQPSILDTALKMTIKCPFFKLKYVCWSDVVCLERCWLNPCGQINCVPCLFVHSSHVIDSQKTRGSWLGVQRG